MNVYCLELASPFACFSRPDMTTGDLGRHHRVRRPATRSERTGTSPEQLVRKAYKPLVFR